MNCLERVPFEGVFIDVYKETRRNTRRNADIMVIQLASMVDDFPQTINAWNSLSFIDAQFLANFRSKL